MAERTVAAVMAEVGAPLDVREFAVDAPPAGEVLVRMARERGVPLGPAHAPR